MQSKRRNALQRTIGIVAFTFLAAAGVGRGGTPRGID